MRNQTVFRHKKNGQIWLPKVGPFETLDHPDMSEIVDLNISGTTAVHTTPTSPLIVKNLTFDFLGTLTPDFTQGHSLWVWADTIDFNGLAILDVRGDNAGSGSADGADGNSGGGGGGRTTGGAGGSGDDGADGTGIGFGSGGIGYGDANNGAYTYGNGGDGSVGDGTSGGAGGAGDNGSGGGGGGGDGALGAGGGGGGGGGLLVIVANRIIGDAIITAKGGFPATISSVSGGAGAGGVVWIATRYYQASINNSIDVSPGSTQAQEPPDPRYGTVTWFEICGQKDSAELGTEYTLFNAEGDIGRTQSWDNICGC